MACGGSLVSMVLVWVLLPTKTKKSDTQAQGVQDKQEGKINYLSYVVLNLVLLEQGFWEFWKLDKLKWSWKGHGN